METYKEALLPASFAEPIHSQVRRLVEEGQTFSLLGITASGASPFLKFIATQNYTFFIHIDCYELPKFTKDAFLELLYKKISGESKMSAQFDDCKRALEKLLRTHKRIVIVVNKFDLLHKNFTEAFLGNFRTICHSFSGKVSFIFGITKPYIEYRDKAVAGSNMHLFSRYVYFPLYEKADLLAVMKLHSPELLQKSNLEKALKLAGGHIQLTQLILRSDYPNNLLVDPYITTCLKSIMEPLSSVRKRVVRKIAEGDSSVSDPLLEKLGFVKVKGKASELFSPLLKEYLQKGNQSLPFREQKLLNFLMHRKGKIASKQLIFQYIWGNKSEEASDWALDSLIYRIRQHPHVKELGVQIKSYKKQGYGIVE